MSPNTQARGGEVRKAQLAKLLASKPESGEQWAEICRLEAEIQGTQVALCDCCDKRPGVRVIDTGALAGETWVCNECCGLPECPDSPTGAHIRRLAERTCLYCDCTLSPAVSCFPPMSAEPKKPGRTRQCGIYEAGLGIWRGGSSDD